MGRPKGSKNKPKNAAEAGEESTNTSVVGNGIGHNSGEERPTTPADLTEDQREVLTFSHKRAYQTALAKQKAAAAEFKNVCKRARAELGDDAIDTIKDMILFESEDGEAKIRAIMERQMRAARYMAAALGSQFEMFEDRTPAVDRARAEGRRDAMAGEPLSNPYDASLPQADAYAEGWHEGQTATVEAQKVRDGALFDEAERLVEEKGISGAVAEAYAEGEEAVADAAE